MLEMNGKRALKELFYLKQLLHNHRMCQKIPDPTYQNKVPIPQFAEENL